MVLAFSSVLLATVNGMFKGSQTARIHITELQFCDFPNLWQDLETPLYERIL